MSFKVRSITGCSSGTTLYTAVHLYSCRERYSPIVHLGCISPGDPNILGFDCLVEKAKNSRTADIVVYTLTSSIANSQDPKNCRLTAGASSKVTTLSRSRHQKLQYFRCKLQKLLRKRFAARSLH